MVRRAIESLYKGRCTITNAQKVFDETTKRTTFKDVVIVENEPCRLSYENKSASGESDTITSVNQTIKLFVRPELEIKAGSKIEVNQNGRTVKFVASGQPAVYSNHQEIILTLEDVRA